MIYGRRKRYVPPPHARYKRGTCARCGRQYNAAGDSTICFQCSVNLCIFCRHVESVHKNGKCLACAAEGKVCA